MEKTSKFVYKYLETVLVKEISKAAKTMEDTSSLAPVVDDVASLPSTLKEKLSLMNNQPFVWSRHAFICPSDIALNWTKEGPFLFKIPSLLLQHKHLVKALNIVEDFSADKLVEILRKMASQSAKKTKTLSRSYHPIVDDILSCLCKMKDEEDLENIEDVILPNNKYELYSVKDLAFNDTPWIKPKKDFIFVHDSLVRKVARKLGVESNRTKFISRFEKKVVDESSMELDETKQLLQTGQEFGQKEPLTQRIKNILRSYQLDSTFMKEFLQNADDAEATQLFVILDKRNHKTKYTFSKSWNEQLQGPALMIWNNKDFSDKDLEGIQSLGSGSKQNDPDSIGEFGIGFNVVYHITDCPSLLTRQNVLCVFDPCCQYLPTASERNPGGRFDTNSEFWSNFQDLRHPLFKSDKPIPGQPECLKGGSLFRFPLRCCESKKRIAEPISVESMEKHLNDWVTDVKESLLFLNHIKCFKMLVIDNDGFQTKVSYEVSANRKMCRQKEFKPTVDCYPLSITSTDNEGNICSESWFIQQGIGDVMPDHGNHSREMMPYNEIPDESHQLMAHGIAAPLTISTSVFRGKVFCFLPLPGNSGLPVHINGRFVLNDSRRGLWNGNSDDVKSKWNNALITALSSSYAKLIENVRQYLIKSNDDADMESLLDRFYSLFPYWLERQQSSEHEHIFREVQMMKECKEIAKCFFEKISVLNNNILASEGPLNTSIQWNPIIMSSEDDLELSHDQVYFCNDYDVYKKEILEMIGMKLTCAPDHLRIHLQDHDRDQLVINEVSVSKFYLSFHQQIIPAETLPCNVSRTPFETVLNFKTFLEIITRNKKNTIFREFVQSPVGLPVIITADENLRIFKEKETISSAHYYLFPESSCLFLHESLMELELDKAYFTTRADNHQIESLMEANFSKLSQDVVKYPVSKKLLPAIQNLWNCLKEENVFEGSHKYVLSNWAMLPCTNCHLYRSSSTIKPVQGENENMIKLLNKVSVPILDPQFESFLHDLHDNSSCPCISSHFNEILAILYEVYQHQNYIFRYLRNSERKQLLKYLGRCSFRYNWKILHQIKSLPLFDTIDGYRKSLDDKTVYLWPKKLTKGGYSTWKQDDVVFLEHTGSWTNLCGNDFSVLGNMIDILDVYNHYIFKCFRKLSKRDQKWHLMCIKDSIYKDAIYQRESFQNESSNDFLSTLSKLKCIEDSSGECLAIEDLCDPHNELFTTFKHLDMIKPFPDEFLEEDWIEFFKALGIRENVTKDEYLQLCEEVPQHCDIQKASNVLIECLFSKHAAENGWYNDDRFIQKLKTIKFVVADEMKNHSWIMPPVWKVSKADHVTVHLMSFNEPLASYDDCADTVWTVMPCLKLPRMDDENTYEHNDLINKLGIICEPLVQDIYQNIINLAKSPFANFQLFFQYSAPVPDENDRDLFEIMIKNIEKLSQIDDETSCTHLKKLQSVSCIPVCASSTVKKPVLVNSHQVVVSKSCDLDNRLSPYIQFISGSVHRINDPLLKMGMNSVISLKNIQYVLQVAYDQFKEVQCIPLNEQFLLNACIEKLNMLLHNVNSSVDELTALKPLYLPSSNGSMKPASVLLYLDCARYQRHIQPDQLHNSGYSLFKIPPNADGICAIDEEKICLQLTADLSPMRFSLVCYEDVDSPQICADDEQDGGLYKHFCNLQQLLLAKCDSIEQDFVDLLSHKFPDRLDDIKCFTKTVINILQNIQLIKVNDLQVKIIIDDVKVCRVKEDFCLKRNTSKFCMYIDNNIMVSPHSSVWKDASHLLCIQVALASFNIRGSLFLPFLDSLSSFLQIVSQNDMKSMLQNKPNWNNTFEGTVHVEVGTDITQKWLDDYEFIKHPENVFRHQEYIGFEIEGKLVWSIVLEVGDDDQYTIALINDESINVCAHEIFKVCPKKSESLNQQMCAIFSQPEQSLEEARRWLRQAECDYEAMEILFKAAEKQQHAHDVTSPALFMAFSVLEKVLKSAMYGLNGLSDYLLHGHDVRQLAILVCNITNKKYDLRQTANHMSNYYLNTRYPNRHSLPNTPSSVYSFSPYLCEQTVRQTKEALQMVKQIIEEAESEKNEPSISTCLNFPDEDD